MISVVWLTFTSDGKELMWGYWLVISGCFYVLHSLAIIAAMLYALKSQQKNDVAPVEPPKDSNIYVDSQFELNSSQQEQRV